VAVFVEKEVIVGIFDVLKLIVLERSAALVRSETPLTISGLELFPPERSPFDKSTHLTVSSNAFSCTIAPTFRR